MKHLQRINIKIMENQEIEENQIIQPKLKFQGPIKYISTFISTLYFLKSNSVSDSNFSKRLEQFE